MTIHKQGGMSLIELMIVVAIVGILAAIAYPSYREQIRRSNRTEAKVELERRAAALEKCYTRYMAYTDANCTAIPAGASFNTEHNYYTVTPNVQATTFTLTAVPNGDQANDRCQSLALLSTGERQTTGSGMTVRDCW